jgi:hypothetical protein
MCGANAAEDTAMTSPITDAQVEAEIDYRAQTINAIEPPWVQSLVKTLIGTIINLRAARAESYQRGFDEGGAISADLWCKQGFAAGAAWRQAFETAVVRVERDWGILAADDIRALRPPAAPAESETTMPDETALLRQALRDCVRYAPGNDAVAETARQALSPLGIAPPLSASEPAGAPSEGWIRVSQRLPDVDQTVIISCPFDDGAIYYWAARLEDGDGWLWGVGGKFGLRVGETPAWNDIEADDDYAPTHWRPLFDPPSL